MKALQTR